MHVQTLSVRVHRRADCQRETQMDPTDRPTARPPMARPAVPAAHPALSDLAWQKSRRSNPSGNCVELAGLPDGGIAIRNSRHPDGPVLVYTRDEIAAFVGGARDGDFDNLIG